MTNKNNNKIKKADKDAITIKEVLKEAGNNTTLKEAAKELKETLKEAGLSATANDESTKQFIGQVKIDLNNPSPAEEVKEDYLLEKVDATTITEKAETAESKTTEECHLETEENRIRDLNDVYFYKNLVNIARKKRNEASFCNLAPVEITKEFIFAINRLEFAKARYERYEKDYPAKSALGKTFIYSICCESCDAGVYPEIVYITETAASKILNNRRIEKRFINGTENIMCYENGYEIRLMRHCLGEILIDRIFTLEDAIRKILLDDKRFKCAEDQKESSEELQ